MADGAIEYLGRGGGPGQPARSFKKSLLICSLSISGIVRFTGITVRIAVS